MTLTTVARRAVPSLLACAAAAAAHDLGAQTAGAAVPPPERQIAAAVSPAPAALRDGATVLGYAPDGRLVTLRPGKNELTCLADEPGDDRFHVACYHKALEPFMARGRELRKQGGARGAVDSVRLAEVRAGRLRMPERPAALYSLTAPADSVDPASGLARGASPLYVLYIPYATPESTGLPTSAPRGQPWLMSPGTPWAHVMIVP